MSARLRPRISLKFVGALALLITTAIPAEADSGDLDPTFDGDGKVTTDFAGGPDGVNALAIQGNGRIVAVGTGTVGGNWNFHLARYNPDGSLDSTFGVGGKVSTDFGGGEDFAYAVAIQADGRIVAVGCTFCALGVADFALVRYNADGSLDPTFGIGGRMITDFSGLRDGAFAVALQANGKIVAAGCVACEQVAGDFAIARYNPDGSLDTTLDGDGKVTTDLSGGEDHGNAVAIQADERIVAAGRAFETNLDFGLVRYNPDGSLDTTFDGDGKVTTDFSGDEDNALGLAIQGDGKIVAAGCAGCGTAAPDDFALARYNEDGSLDPTFNGNGKVTADIIGSDAARAVAIQGDGKIVTAGVACATCFFAGYFALARHNKDGSVDTSFGGGDGKVTTDFSNGADEAGGVAIQADGKIVAAGFAGTADSDFALARYTDDPDADLSITKAGPPGRVPTGRDMTYTLTVPNDGPDSAVGVTVTDQLPSSVTFVSTATTQGSCGELNGTVFCTLGAMSSGAIVTIEIAVRPTTAGMITNSASVASLTPDPNQGNNAASEDTSICRITSRRSSIPCR